MRANCTSQAGWQSALAPASSRTVGVEPGTGMGVAIAGRDTPLMRPIRSSAEAIVAPVLPAETIAEALPSRTASAARTSEESFIVRTLEPGSADMPMTCEASIRSRSPRSGPTAEGRPTSTTGTPSSAAALWAPSMMASGALSPPMASMAIGSIVAAGATVALSVSGVPGAGRPAGRSVDLDGDTAAVPATVAAHHVGQLGVVAAGADATSGTLEAPRAGPAAAALGLGGLLLGDGHGSLPATSRWGAWGTAREGRQAGTNGRC